MIIRTAEYKDLSRIAEIFVFNNRINYYPIFKDPSYSFGELQVVSLIDNYFSKPEVLQALYAAEDEGLVKGFIEVYGEEVRKLYADPFFQNQGIGHELLDYAVHELGVKWLWALEKNEKARRFYHRHGFTETGEKVLEEDTTEYLLKLSLHQ